MKKFKTILSIALICVLTLGGGILLTGCVKDKPDVSSPDIRIGEMYIQTITLSDRVKCFYILFSNEDTLYYYEEEWTNSESASNLFTAHDRIIENGKQFICDYNSTSYYAKFIEDDPSTEFVEEDEVRIEAKVLSKNEIRFSYKKYRYGREKHTIIEATFYYCATK